MVGAVTLAVGAMLLAGVDAARGPVYATVAATVIGFGVGFSNNNYMLSAQVSVAHNQRGLASSTNMFTRIVGTAIGAALFGGVLNFELARRLPGAASGVVEKLLEPHSRDALLAGADARLIGEIAASIHSVFLLAAVLSVAVFAFAWNMPRGLNLHSPPPAN
jgi:hypothetical protein